LIAVGEVVAPREGDVPGATSEGEIRLSAVLKGKTPPGAIRFAVVGPPIPVGAKAIWFLRPPRADGTYVIDHPQCAYDVTHRTVLDAAMRSPERIRPGYFLRREDEQLALAVREAAERRRLRSLPAGAPQGGLQLSTRALCATVRAGGAVVIEYVVSNRSDAPVLLCDSPQECYFARAAGQGGGDTKPSDDVARAGSLEIDMESALGLGQLVSEHDFVTLLPGKSVSRSLTLSPKRFSSLNVVGKTTIWGIYRYRPPRTPLVRLPSNPWTGAVAALPVVVTVLPRIPVRRIPVRR
jgi:hypothetical protein